MATPAVVCAVCGEPLNAIGECVACLLRTGLNKSNLEPEPDAILFGNFHVARREDGSLWELGHGAMGVTYLAADHVLQRNVALKVIEVPAAARSSGAVRDRFLREARAAASVRHPNVAAIFQFGASPDGSHRYYAMELVEGETLEARVRRDGPLNPEIVLKIATQVGRALMAAAERGLVHRDIKPGNIMLMRSNAGELEVKVIDFGLAKAIATPEGEMDLTHGEFVGTPNFASPEQFGSGPVDVRSDIYSLGATLWFALTGLAPRSGTTIAEIRDRQAHEDLPLEQLVARKVPKPLIKLLGSTLAIDPGKRPASARELMEGVNSCRRKIRLGVFYKMAALIAVAVAVAATLFSLQVNRRRTTANVARDITLSRASLTAAPHKSIAVLPFEYLSEDKANVYFAEGIQDEIRTRLANIADLKVISHASTQRYKSAPENLPEIARQLGVADILEGRVQKSGDAVRVNVQLIKAANDSQLWAATYDRKLTDIFSVESEVARAIAEQLQAKLTAQEKQVIAVKPTNNPAAYDAYLRGLAYSMQPLNAPANSVGAQKYLREAVRLDPKFALAWALLSYVDAIAYRTGNLEPTVALRDEARQTAETAVTLQPNLGEAIWAKGFYHYAILKDYNTALRDFERARQVIPNSSQVAASLAYLMRRRGQWDRSESYFNEAERLDPRNASLFYQHGLSYIALRRFREALQKFDQVLNITPDDVDTVVQKAHIAQAEGDLPRAAALIAPLQPNAADDLALITQLYQAILERSPGTVIPRLKEILAKPDPALRYNNGQLRFYLGWAQDLAGDHAGAQESWRQARSELEASLKQRQDVIGIGNLALTDVGLGDKAAALVLAEQGITANPIEKDALSGADAFDVLARVAARTGEPDRAIAALQKVLSTPSGGFNVPLTPALIRLDPDFDSLRNDPRFDKLVKRVDLK